MTDGTHFACEQSVVGVTGKLDDPLCEGNNTTVYIHISKVLWFTCLVADFIFVFLFCIHIIPLTTIDLFYIEGQLCQRG